MCVCRINTLSKLKTNDLDFVSTLQEQRSITKHSNGATPLPSHLSKHLINATYQRCPASPGHHRPA